MPTPKTTQIMTGLIIISNGKEQLIDLTNIKSLTLTLKNNKIDIKYLKKIKHTISTLPQKTLPAPSQNTMTQPENRQSSKGKYILGPINVNDIPISTMCKAYKKYREAVTVNKGTKIAKKLSEEWDVNKTTITVWLSQMRQVIHNTETKTPISRAIRKAGKQIILEKGVK